MRHASEPHRNNNPRSGQSMVEFGMTFTLVMMLFLGIFEMGRAMWSFTTVSYAARQAARYAIVRSQLGAEGADSAAIDNMAKASAIGLDPDRLTVSKSWTPDNHRGSQFVITVQYPVDFVGASLFMKNRNTLTVSSTASYTILN
ncbi:MAG: hypothetical protein GC160_00410 [Acidobacteria bacterium]|nr:hypothetical protein [Acidobacteriota bacterium]